MDQSIMKAKLQQLSAEGERIRVRFAVPSEPNVIGDFLLKADHPVIPNLKIGKQYEVFVREVEGSPPNEG